MFRLTFQLPYLGANSGVWHSDGLPDLCKVTTLKMAAIKLAEAYLLLNATQTRESKSAWFLGGQELLRQLYLLCGTVYIVSSCVWLTKWKLFIAGLIDPMWSSLMHPWIRLCLTSAKAHAPEVVNNPSLIVKPMWKMCSMRCQWWPSCGKCLCCCWKPHNCGACAVGLVLSVLRKGYICLKPCLWMSSFSCEKCVS